MNYLELPGLPRAAFSGPTGTGDYFSGYTATQMRQYALLACGDLQRQLADLTEDYKDLEAQLMAVGAGGVSKLMGDQE